MKKRFLLFVFLIPVLSVAQHAVIPSKMYPWEKPTKKIETNLLSTTLFEGSGFDMEYIQMNTMAILPSNKKINLQVPNNEEHLLLIKTGTLAIGIKDSSWSIGGGSIALLMPGERYTVQNKTKDSCTYYVLKYRSKLPMDASRGNASGGSLIKDWNKITFKPHDRGGSRHYFERPTAMSKRFEMHVTTLKEGVQSHPPHTHHAEEIILVIENKTEMQIGDQLHKGDTGDVYFIGSNISHGIRNDGKGTCSYFAFQFE